MLFNHFTKRQYTFVDLAEKEISQEREATLGYNRYVDALKGRSNLLVAEMIASSVMLKHERQVYQIY